MFYLNEEETFVENLLFLKISEKDGCKMRLETALLYLQFCLHLLTIIFISENQGILKGDVGGNHETHLIFL